MRYKVIILAVLSLTMSATTRGSDAADTAATPDEVVIDNFDLSAVSGLYSGRRNMVGGYHGSWGQRPSYVNMYKEVENPWGQTGASLALHYYRGAGTCGWYTKLEGMDATALNILRFMVRGRKGGETVRIGMCDEKMLTFDMDPVFIGTIDTYLPGGIGTDWKEVRIPFRRVGEKIDLTQLGKLVLEFTGEGDGEVFLDDISFVFDGDIENELTASIPAVTSNVCSRGLYVWDLDPVDRPEGATTLLDFCEQTQISSLLLDTTEITRRIRDASYETQLSAFVEEARRRGLQVIALAGKPSWSTSRGHGAALRHLESILTYNQNHEPTERFSGVHYDIEIHTTALWRQQRDKIKKSYLELIDKIHERVREVFPRSKDFSFSVAISEDYIHEGKEFLEPVIAATDEIVLMSYHDTHEAVMWEITPAIPWITALDTRFQVAVETQDLVAGLRGRDDQSFFEEGWQFMEEEIESLAEQLSEHPLFAGVIIHHYDSYRFMKKLPGGAGL